MNGNVIEGKPIGCVFVCVCVLLLRCVVARGKRVPFWQHMPMKFSECTPFFSVSHSGTLEGSHSGKLTLTGILHTLTHTLSTLLEAVPACSTPVLCVHVASYYQRKPTPV